MSLNLLHEPFACEASGPFSLAWCCPACGQLWAVLETGNWVHHLIATPCRDCRPWPPWHSAPGSLCDRKEGLDEDLLAALSPALLRREFDLHLRQISMETDSERTPTRPATSPTPTTIPLEFVG